MYQCYSQITNELYTTVFSHLVFWLKRNNINTAAVITEQSLTWWGIALCYCNKNNPSFILGCEIYIGNIQGISVPRPDGEKNALRCAWRRGREREREREREGEDEKTRWETERKACNSHTTHIACPHCLHSGRDLHVCVCVSVSVDVRPPLSSPRLLQSPL